MYHYVVLVRGRGIFEGFVQDRMGWGFLIELEIRRLSGNSRIGLNLWLLVEESNGIRI